ncbi:MAG: AAA family ATPase [Acidimicrobiales bacterium]
MALDPVPGDVEATIPSPAQIVLVGPSAAGKSTWAEANFRVGQVLSSDQFRAFVGAGPDDQTAGTEAFALLH